jgi:hypothetical protein
VVVLAEAAATQVDPNLSGYGYFRFGDNTAAIHATLENLCRTLGS